MKQAQDQERRMVWLTNAASVLAILTCYGTALVLASLASVGVVVAIDEGLWAATIALFALAAFIATLFGYRRHGLAGPAMTAGAGVALVLWTLFVSYDWWIEFAGFFGLALAAVWQWRLAEHQENGG